LPSGQPITFEVFRTEAVANGAGNRSLSAGPVPGAYRLLENWERVSLEHERINIDINARFVIHGR